ncbi:Rep [Mosquito VEM virus SDBVL G]|uniref:Rep n=1 Tax=Mosquito VEM virus SDBVL G TaxID=1034805 RepID=F6KIE0_9VIRU|nr:Rep [Mosquito VEM virus SDBVL G]AEF58771.1 Rep [Mosquito VEM virus SDBVL G]
MPSFAIKDAKFLLLTYAQVPEDVVTELPLRLLHLCTEHDADVIIGKEQHSDGGIHFHAFLDFRGSKFSTRNERFWDIAGRHPNIARVGRTPWKAYDYAIKDNDIVGGTATRPEEGGGGSGGNKQHEDWTYICEAISEEVFFDRIRERRPGDLVRSFCNIRKYADWHYRAVPEPYSTPEEYRFSLADYVEIDNWASTNFGGDVATRCVPPPRPSSGLGGPRA